VDSGDIFKSGNLKANKIKKSLLKAGIYS
jgi:hypothetical protein